MTCTKFAFGILLTFDPKDGDKISSFIAKKKEAHVPPHFFTIFTRRRVDLNSQ